MQDKSHPDTDPEAAALLERAYSLENEAEARALYAQWAKTYDETMISGLGYRTPEATAKLLCAVLSDDTAAILDVGSGTGLAGAELARLGYEVIDGLDYSPQMLEVARSRDVYRNLIVADLNQPLNLQNSSYDAIICTGTFTHAHVGAGCLGELFRILKSGGLFACTVHMEVWEPAGFATVTDRLEREGVMKTLYREPGTYYSTSEAPEGWYILWQKC